MSANRLSEMAPPTPEGRAAAARRLTIVEKLDLAREVVTTYGHARVWLRRHELRDVVALLRPKADAMQAPDGNDLLQCVRLARIVRRTLGALPADSRCLIRSLVLTAMLARRNIFVTLVIGVKPGPSFEAHAWVELAGYPLLPPGDAAYGRLLEL
jgi:hypothetical protein